jgi:peptidoglycan-N-acetylglucosamine deacetylase
MGSGVRIRWDRVFILLAVLTTLIVLITNAIVRAVTSDDPESAEPAAASAPPPAAPPAAEPCPTAGSEVLRTAPHEEGQRTVALTFDDGPGKLTDEVLGLLAQQNVKATFFVVGKEAAADPDRIREMHVAGHAVENHSWSHPSARRGRWNPEVIGKEIERTSAAITEITGQPPCYFRPPQGVVPGSEDKAAAAGLTIALWSVDTRDWAVRGAKAIRTRAQEGLDEPNPIVLLHDGGGDRQATLAALPGIIEDYRNAGYAFVTLDPSRT